MSYAKPDGIPCNDGEIVVLLDSGQYVAAQCPTARDPQNNNLAFTPAARWIDAAGAQKLDGSGRPVTTTKTHNAPAEQVASLTANVIARECLYLVLGEPLTPDPEYPELNLMKFSAANIAQCSIRNAIASASVTAPDAGEVL